MRLARPALLLAFSSLLAACGGGGDDAGGAGVTVTPALGKVSYAEVRLRSLDGTLLAAGNLGSEGSLRLPRPAAGGLVVEVSGGNGVYYFDEGAGGARPLAAGQVLHAVSSGPRDRIAITALTEIVYQRALALAAGGPLTPALVATAEAEVAAAFGAPESGSFLDDPALLDDALDVPDASTMEGRAARWLAGLADLALQRRRATRADCDSQLDCAPLPEFITDLATDFADGSLDGLANGAPLGSVFYDTGSVATLLADIDSAASHVVTRIDAALAANATDKRMGQFYAGDYPLTCRNTTSTSPRNVALRLSIGSDGGFLLTTPQGVIALPAGSSASSLQAVTGNSGYARAGIVLPAWLTLAGGKPVSDGLVININPPGGVGLIQFESTILSPATGNPYHVMIGADAAGGGFLLWKNTAWTCTGMPASVASATASVADWLPDGSYDCETADPGVLATASVSGGTLSIGGHSWTYTTAARTEETQHGPLDLPDTGAHAHAGDAIALARWPVQQLVLKAALDGSGNSLRLRRSLSTGFGYFNATLDGVTYQHCLANAAQVSASNGLYTRSAASSGGSGSGTITAFFGNPDFLPIGSVWVGAPGGAGGIVNTGAFL